MDSNETLIVEKSEALRRVSRLAQFGSVYPGFEMVASRRL